jgi:hypothetical protein
MLAEHLLNRASFPKIRLRTKSIYAIFSSSRSGMTSQFPEETIEKGLFCRRTGEAEVNSRVCINAVV